MAFIFPEDKNDFTAPNGIIYRWDGNKWAVKAFRSTEDFIVELGDDPPENPKEGDLWYDTKEEELTLYIWTGKVWVPAAPPVSLDGIEASIASVDEQLLKVNANIAMNKRDIDEAVLDFQEDQERQDEELQDLRDKVESIQEEFDRGKWTHVTEKPGIGQYGLGKKVNSQYCQSEYLKCLEEAGDDAVAASRCLRGMEDCEQAATENPDHMVYVDHWGGVDHIAIHTEEADGEKHGFGDYTVGKYIEIINEADESNATYQIVEDAKIENGVAIVKVSDIQATGAPNGLGRFKVFEMKASDPTEYVKKSGSTMTGKLEINKPVQSSNTNSFKIMGRINGKITALLKDYRRAESSAKSDYMEYFGTTQSDHSIANKKTIQGWINASLAAPAQLSWEFHKRVNGYEKNGPSNGTFHNDGDWYIFSFMTANGINLNVAPTTTRPEGDWGPHDEDQFLMTFWRKSGTGGWDFVTHFECNKVHWGCQPDVGAVHFKFRKRWSSHGSATSTEPALLDNQTYFVTVGGFF